MTRARNLANRASDIVSVKDFGAKGDGVTDDSAAFTAALAASKSIYLGGPGQTYRIASFVAIPDQNLYADTAFYITGDGATVRIDAAMAPFTSAAWAANQTLTTNPYTGKVFVSGINFTGTAPDGAFDCDHIYNLIVERCHFDGMSKVFTSSRAKTGYPNGYIQSLFVRGCIFSDISDAIISAKNAFNVVFDANQCEMCVGGIKIDGTGAYAINTLRVTNNLYEGGGVFVTATSTLGGTISGNYLESNSYGDIGTRKCHFDLTYDTVAVGSSAPSTWLIQGNTSGDTLSQRNDVDFGMAKINGSYDSVTVVCNWANSAVTVSPIRNVYGNYSRRFQKYNIPTSPQQALFDYKSSLYDRDLAVQIVSTNRLNILSLQLSTDITATDFRGAAINCSVVLKGKVATGEIFGECSFDLKLFLSPYGSGIPSAKGKPTNWDVRAVLSNYLEQTTGVVVDTTTGAQTVSLFPGGTPSLAVATVGTVLYIRLIGFNVGATIPGYGPFTKVLASTLMSINGSNVANGGSAVNWIEMVN